jgi:hypothetical protein
MGVPSPPILRDLHNREGGFADAAVCALIAAVD